MLDTLNTDKRGSGLWIRVGYRAKSKMFKQSSFMVLLSLVSMVGFSSSAVGQSDKVKDVTFDDFKFDMELGEPFRQKMLTDDILKLNLTKLRVRGYIRPSTKESGISKFVFVRDNMECCFGPGAMLYDCVLVEMAKGEEVDFTVRPITLEGTFYIKTYKGRDGKVWAVYRMKDAQKK